MATLALALIVAFAFMVQTTIGFGSVVLGVTFGAHLFPIRTLLPLLVALSLVNTVYIVGRDFHFVRWEVLFRRILPWMMAGMPLGFWLYWRGDNRLLKLGFGLLVACVALFELWRLRCPKGGPRASLSNRQGAKILLGAGFVHGLFASSGPLVVYYVTRQLEGKAAIRSTLCVLWLLLDIVLLGSYFSADTVGPDFARLFPPLLGATLAGIIVGEKLHRHLDPPQFQKMVFSILAVAGVSLILAP